MNLNYLRMVMKSKHEDLIFSSFILQTELVTLLPKKYQAILAEFLTSYEAVIRENRLDPQNYVDVICEFLSFLILQLKNPYQFPPYHAQVLKNFYFGKNFLRPLIDFPQSKLEGLANVNKIDEYLKKGENVVLLANHQIEADPQVLYLMLEKTHPEFSQQIIFVAGERVVTDPLAIPFSLGCNLFCIYSKKYIDNPPEKKHEKQIHNKRTMQLMSEKFSEGGKCIYVAPSGGRDRRGPNGKVEVAPFDPQSIEMIYLMSERASKKTHFFPLSLATFAILPPPEDIQIELGERRTTKGGAVFVHFGEELNMEKFPGCDLQDRQEKRKARATYIHGLVQNSYSTFPINY